MSNINTISQSGDLLRNIDVGEMLRLREQLADLQRKLELERMKANTPKNCERPELCLLTEGSIPCAICPHRSDTPRTDAQGYGDGRHPYVPTEFARQLERELEQERALADRLGRWMEDHRKVWCHHRVDPDCECEDCAFLVPFDEALAAWKEARDATQPTK